MMKPTRATVASFTAVLSPLAVLVASLAGALPAWGGEVPFTEHVISTNADGAFSVFATDVDGDRDMDVLSGSSNDNKIRRADVRAGGPALTHGYAYESQAVCQTDQMQDNVIIVNVDIGGLGQTFTVGTTGQLCIISIYVQQSSADMIIDIRPASIPGGPDPSPANALFSTTILFGALPPQPGNWVDIDVSAAGICVFQGDVLAITTRPASGGAQAWHHSFGTNPYADGDAWIQSPGGGSWQPLQPASPYDFAFETRVESLAQTCQSAADCDDGVFCTIDTCVNCVCDNSLVNCNAFGDECNDAACDTNGPDVNCDILTPVSDGTPCPSGDACIQMESCVAGSCAGTPAPDGTPCPSGNACMQSEECSGGVCVGNPVICGPNAVCDPATGNCVPINDLCANAIPIPDCSTLFDNIGAMTDGPPHPMCPVAGDTYQDIWYDYTATSTGNLTVSTCGQANYDAHIVVYDGCLCGNPNPLGCSHHTAGCTSPDVQVDVAVVAGNCYKIRVGAPNLGGLGSGVIDVTYELQITSQPASQSVAAGAPVTFSVAVSGPSPITYQWRKGGAVLVDGPAPGCGTISGSNTDTLAISGVGCGDAGVYDVVVANACVTETSMGASLTTTPSACPLACGNSVVHTYEVLGDANCTSWSWRIESTSGAFLDISNDNAPGVPPPVCADCANCPCLPVNCAAGGALEVAQAFADSINATAGCPVESLLAQAADVFGTVILSIRTGCNSNFELFVGAAGAPATCQVQFGLPVCGFNPTIEQLPLPGNDCNGNGFDDVVDILSGNSPDANQNGIPDECERCVNCPTDVNGDGFTEAFDLAVLLGAWGCNVPPIAACLADSNGCIAAAQLAVLLGSWGPCP